jgi:hypothetical protein
MSPLDKLQKTIRNVTSKLQKTLKKGGYLSTSGKNHKRATKKYRKHARKSRSAMTALFSSVINK